MKRTTTIIAGMRPLLYFPPVRCSWAGCKGDQTVSLTQRPACNPGQKMPSCRMAQVPAGLLGLCVGRTGAAVNRGLPRGAAPSQNSDGCTGKCKQHKPAAITAMRTSTGPRNSDLSGAIKGKKTLSRLRAVRAFNPV